MNGQILKSLLSRRSAVLRDIWRGEGVVARLHQDLTHLEAVIRMIDPEIRFNDNAVMHDIVEDQQSDPEPVFSGITPSLARNRFH